MTIKSLKREITEHSLKFAFIKQVELVDETENAIKLRLVVSESIFIQVYQNILTGTTNYCLIKNLQRIYGRDSIGGKWHRHPLNETDKHEFLSEGTAKISIEDFFTEVEDILLKENLL